MTTSGRGIALIALCMVVCAAAFSQESNASRTRSMRWSGSIEGHLCTINRSRFLAKVPEDIDEHCNEGMDREEDESALSPTPSSILSGRIKSGNVLDVLAASVILFFLATAFLSGGKLFEPTTQYASTEGAARVYKYVDAEELLREDFDRESSKVIF